MSGSVNTPSNLSTMDTMSRSLARNWGAIAARGVAGVLFGLFALVRPDIVVGSLTLLFAAYMLVDGVFAIVAGLRAAARHERWGLLVLEGLVNFGAGAAALLYPGLTVLLLITLLGTWAIISGIVMLIAAFRLNAGHGRWLLAVPGLLSIVWGALLYMQPLLGALVLATWLGGYALAFGALLLVLAVRLRARHTRPGPASGAIRAA